MDLDIDKLSELRFIEKSSVYEKNSTAVRRANEKPEPNGLWFSLSSGGWIRTNDLRVMSPSSYLCSTPQYTQDFTTPTNHRQAT
jgi:hypothetical protein